MTQPRPHGFSRSGCSAIIASSPSMQRMFHFSLSLMYLQRWHFLRSWSRKMCRASGERALPAILRTEKCCEQTDCCLPDPTLSPSELPPRPSPPHPPISPTDSFQCAPPIRGHLSNSVRCARRPLIFLTRIAARMQPIAVVVGIAASAARCALRGPSVDKLIRPCGKPRAAKMW